MSKPAAEFVGIRRAGFNPYTSESTSVTVAIRLTHLKGRPIVEAQLSNSQICDAIEALGIAARCRFGDIDKAVRLAREAELAAREQARREARHGR